MEQMMNQNTNMEMNMDTGAAKKQGKGMMFGMIACAVLAIGGIGFGIYEMSQVKTAKQQIADLKIEVKKDDGSTTTIETDKIEVKEADKTVVITDSAKTGTSPFDPAKGLNISYDDDSIISQICHQNMAGFLCLNSDRTSVSATSFSLTLASSLNLTEAGGKNYEFTTDGGKISDFYVGSWGQAAGDETLFFIMDDGSLEYVPLRYALKNNDFSAKKVEGVSDIVKVVMYASSSANGASGGVNSAAVKADGSWYDLYRIIGGRDTAYYAM